MLFQNKLEISCDDFIGKRSKKYLSNNIDVAVLVTLYFPAGHGNEETSKRKQGKGTRDKGWKGNEGKWRGGVTLGYQTDQKLCAVVKEETKKDNV